MALMIVGLFAVFAPKNPIDPWHLLSPQKIAVMIFALVLVQVLGSVMVRLLGAGAGALLAGFFGGLVSSTATTASLARRSNITSKISSGEDQEAGELLTFLAATGAMLFEGLVLVVSGTTEVHGATLLVFMGPMLATLVMILFNFKKLNGKNKNSDIAPFEILPLLKLSLFIIAILSLSKFFQKLWGHEGLVVITALVSLFEIHGSVIANVQLHDMESITVDFLCGLLAISIVASYLSKLFLIATIGSSKLRLGAVKSTSFLLVSLAISWFVAITL